MKKIIAILATTVAALSLASCTFDTQIYTNDYIVRPIDWKESKGGSALETYLYATFPNEHITRSVVQNGSVSASLYISSENTWTPLTYVMPFEYRRYDTFTGQITEEGVVSEVIRFEWRENEITFIIQDLDGFKPDPVDGDFTFRVSVMR